MNKKLIKSEYLTLHYSYIQAILPIKRHQYILIKTPRKLIIQCELDNSMGISSKVHQVRLNKQSKSRKTTQHTRTFTLSFIFSSVRESHICKLSNCWREILNSQKETNQHKKTCIRYYCSTYRILPQTEESSA